MLPYPERVALAWKGRLTGHKGVHCPVCKRRDFCADECELVACWRCTNMLVDGQLIRRNGTIVKNPKWVAPKVERVVIRKRRVSADMVRQVIKGVKE